MSLPVQFQVEAVVSGVGVVMARQLTPGDFALGERPRLGGVAIRREVSMPRALNSAGQPRFDLFAFRPVSAADLSRFVVGATVGLEVGDAS